MVRLTKPKLSLKCGKIISISFSIVSYVYLYGDFILLSLLDYFAALAKIVFSVAKVNDMSVPIHT